jgi:hypothetical protein
MPAANQIRVEDEPQDVIRQDHLVRVTNGLNFLIKGRFDGKDYVWKPGVHLDIPIAAAEHIFGFGKKESEKMRSLNNLGFLSKFGTYEDAMEQMKSVKFAEPPALVELAPEDPRAKRAPKARKAAAALPLQGGGEAEGESSRSPSTDPQEGDNATL